MTETVLGFAVQMVAGVIGFLLAVVLARLLGAEGFGEYSNALAWVNVIVLFGAFGFPPLVVRETARLRETGCHGRVRALWRLADVRAAGATVTLTLAVGAVAVMTYREVGQGGLLRALLVMVASAPLLVWAQMRQSALVGLGFPVRAQVPRALVPPLTVLSVAGLVWFVGDALTSEVAAGSYLGGSALALLLAASLRRIQAPPGNRRREELDAGLRESLSSDALYLFSVTGLDRLIARVDFILLGYLAGPSAVGMYAVADRLGTLVGTLRSVLNTPLQPFIARMKEREDVGGIDTAARWGGLTSFISSVFGFLLILMFGRNLIELFGSEFAGAWSATLLVASCQVVSGMAGLVSPLLTMTGYERKVARAKAWALALNVTLNAWLIPVYGIMGAASATLASFVLWNVILVVEVRSRLGIDPTIFQWLGGKGTVGAPR